VYKTVSVQFKKHGKIHEFDAGDFALKRGDKVLVETEHGSSLGVVCTEPRTQTGKMPDRPLRRIYRLANQRDVEKFERKCRLERDVYGFCYERIKVRSMPMCLVAVERISEGGKLMVYFTADGRVDFRELVKDLVQKFRTRIEMRQIGVRHQAKMFGGLGSCGRGLCCSSFLDNFSPVSIKMAKNQNLSLNPNKISGMCGRLMCCLTYEHKYYEDARKDIPKVGKRILTKKGEGKILRQNLLRKVMTVILESGEEVEIRPEDIVKDKRRK
jgi:cell fate regulator YaaT (PSP1 superfamily)